MAEGQGQGQGHGRITWPVFLRAAEELVTLARRLGDTWRLVHPDTGDTGPGSSYLADKRWMRHEDSGQLVCWEYHVCYCPSYAVPVIYFHLTDRSGAVLPLPLDKLWKLCTIDQSGGTEEMYGALTQREHPILRRPFFAVHPCRTNELLVCGEESRNPIVTVLSAIGPKINLQMKMEYAFG